ncbi:hypothetical protein, partial [Bradyrhizobium sp.]|uniref:hypothetical protein n=1 Tax=Bradyrhizobium sp. TaxID=376 RepID=UPI0026156F8A
ACQILGLLISRKQLIQKFWRQCRRHVSLHLLVNSQKPAYTELLTPSIFANNHVGLANKKTVSTSGLAGHRSTN